jgi:hypothetical protein
LWEFGITVSVKVGQGDVLLIKQKIGTSGCPEIDSAIASGIVVPREDYYGEYETLRFTPVKPPLVYTLFLLWQGIFPHLSKGARELTTDVDAVLKDAQEYYGSWNHRSPIQRGWIQEALDALYDWGLAARDRSTYKIDLQRPKSKNLKEYFCAKLCKDKKFFATESEEDQKLLSEFDGKHSLT